MPEIYSELRNRKSFYLCGGTKCYQIYAAVYKNLLIDSFLNRDGLLLCSSHGWRARIGNGYKSPRKYTAGMTVIQSLCRGPAAVMTHH